MTETTHKSIFTRADWFCGLAAALVAWAVYFWTAAPNVTLLDSGEFIVAAQHFGVPHPTGYPLWTLLAWLFHLLPLGNAAWEINLFSGFCGGLAVGLAAMLLRSSCLWISKSNARSDRAIATVASLALPLTFAFSLSMWSQAVIAEVYTLHALLIGLYFVSMYTWLRRPASQAPIYWTFFTLTLAFSNHHLSLALAPLPFLIAALTRRKIFLDLCLGVLLSGLIAYLAFALLAEDPLVLKAAIRLTWLTAAIFLIAVLIRRFRLNVRLIAFIPIAIALGMLPYAYLPIASSTNPPMNWGYTRTVEGFFSSFNRSQYQGPLSEQSLRALGPLLGMGERNGKSAVENASAVTNPQPSLRASAIRWVQFFWQKLVLSFSPLAVLLFFAILIPILRCDLEKRVWYYVLLFGFTLAAFLQPVVDRAKIDNSGWWLQMPYHTHTNLIFCVLCGLGAFAALQAVRVRSARLLPLCAGLVLALPLWPLLFNAAESSQRNRWFGWQFGHDMLNALPEGAVVFGGSDPGRFVPTYMIFGESPQPPRNKRDPKFDRRDLYILTQNAVADPLYLAYLRDQYSKNRPPVRNAFEHWLGRDRMYPAEPLRLPSRSTVSEVLKKRAEEMAVSDVAALSRQEMTQLSHSEIARWIFNENKGKHRFFVEESFPMEWTYPHAIPSGLLYEIAAEPLPNLPADVVTADMTFWRDYVAKLLGNPDFSKDYDAQRSFSKLRLTSARIYNHRNMLPETIQAGRESLALWPANLEAIQFLNEVLWKAGEFDEPVQIAETAFFMDPDSEFAARFFVIAENRRAAEPEIAKALDAYARDPGSLKAFRHAADLLGSVGDEERLNSLVESANASLGENDEFLGLSIDIALKLEQWKPARDRAVVRATLANTAPRWLDVSSIEAMQGASKAAIDAFRKAMILDREAALERLNTDPALGALQWSDEVQAMLLEPTPGPGLTDTLPAISPELLPVPTLPEANSTPSPTPMPNQSTKPDPGLSPGR